MKSANWQIKVSEIGDGYLSYNILFIFVCLRRQYVDNVVWRVRNLRKVSQLRTEIKNYIFIYFKSPTWPKFFLLKVI